MPERSATAPASSPAASAPDPESIVAFIAEIAAAQLELAGPVHADARLVEDLALDSLGLTVVAVELENRYRVRLEEQDAEGIATVRDLAELVVRRIVDAESNRGAPSTGLGLNGKDQP